MPEQFVYVIYGLPDDDTLLYWSNMEDAKAYAEARSPYVIDKWLDCNQDRQSYALPVGMTSKLIAIVQQNVQGFRHDDDTPANAQGGDSSE